MRIQHNIMAMNAYRNYNTNNKALSGNLEKLSSGYKINRAGDDAAGLAISEKMRAQITGLNAAQKNVKDGISLVKTAEGAMQEIQDMLNRMDYLATQSANGTYDNEVDRANLQKEVNALKDEINRIADSANFNGIKLLDGSQTSTAMNEDAFAVTSAASVAAGIPGSAQAISTGNFPSATADFALHETVLGNPTQTSVSFKLDLAAFDFKTSLSATDTASIDFNIGGTTISVEVNSATTAGELAAKLKDAANAMVTTGGNGMVIGDSNIAVSASNTAGSSVVEFNFIGIKEGNTINTTGNYTVSQAVSANLNLGHEISVAAGGANAASVSIEMPNHLHGLYDITEAAAKTSTKTAGIDLTLDSSIVKDGNILTIDGKTFGFKMNDSTDFGQAGGASAPSVVIDLRNVKADDQIAEAIRQMTSATNNTTTNFKITSTAPNKIHIDQTLDSAMGTNNVKQEIYNANRLKGTDVFSLQEGNEAKNAGTAITIDESKIRDGDKLVIDDKTYVFTADASRYAEDVAAGKVVTVDLKNAAVDLASKLNAITGQTAEASAPDADGKKTVTIRKNDPDAEVAKVEQSGVPSNATGVNGLNLQIGDTSDSFNQLKVSIGDMHTYAMGTGGKSIQEIDISSQKGAQEAVDIIKNAINYVSGVRGDLGAIQNRLEHTGNNLSVMAENIQDAESTIRDTDVAEEMMSYVKNNILVQSAQAMLAQANQVPQGVLQLLG